MSPLAPVAGSLAHANGKLHGAAASLSPREPHGPSRRVPASLENKTRGVWIDCGPSGRPGGMEGHRGRAGTPPAQVERRTQILDAATRASARSGFVTTSLDEVAAEAGITHVILYPHFDSKAGMYRAVLDRACTRLASRAAHGECIEVLW
jgi:Bacterial regulatory proteins, tetR family